MTEDIPTLKSFSKGHRELVWGDTKPNLPKAKKKGHRCEGPLPESAYGAAVTYCFEDEDGKIWVTNEEYASQVKFCPYCGLKAGGELK